MNANIVIIDMFQPICKQIWQCILDVQDIWSALIVAKSLGKRKSYLKMKNRNIDVNSSKAILRGWLFFCFVRCPKVVRLFKMGVRNCIKCYVFRQTLTNRVTKIVKYRFLSYRCVSFWHTFFNCNQLR